jgi:nitroreductase
MDVFKAIQTRRSIRQYEKDKPVEPDKLKKVLEAGRLAPSASNRQDWKFVVVQDPKTLEKLVEACNGQSFVAEATAFIAACGTNPDPVMSCGQPKHTVDLSIATAYMILEAAELGLGTCWLGSFNEEKVRRLLNIPDSVRVVAVTPLGYPSFQPQAKSRKPLEEVVCYERYS